MHELAFDGGTVAALVSAVGQDLREARRRGRVTLVERGLEGPVTNADLGAQETLIRGLTDRFGPAQIVAEEGMHRHARLGPESSAWIIDPLDGTAEYVAGSPRYGVQVAALSAGRLVGAWICCPDLDWTVSAWEGAALQADAGEPHDDGGGRMMIADGDFDRQHLETLRSRGVSAYRGSNSCAVDYCQVVLGQLDVTLYRRTYPWDHAPGAYLVGRAGGSSMRWDGQIYHPADGGLGLLNVAVGVDLYDAAHRLLP